MNFAEPIWLLAGLTVIVTIFWLYRRFDARQRAALADFASHHLLAKLTASFSPSRRRLKRILFVAAVGLVFIALARPQWGYHWEEQKSRGIDILFAIDTSKSMLTQDVNPNRLTRAKMAITDLVRKLDGDRVGLIAFAGDAFLEAPLTMDYDAFQESLDAVDVGIVPRGGTDISSAIQEAQAALGTEAHNRKILVLVTDGEDLDAKGIDSARAAAKDGLTIYTIGVGSAEGGLIPIPNANGGTDFLKDSSGQFVKSHLDENTLRQIAQVTGGLYEPLGPQGQGLQTLYDQALAPLPKEELASRSEKVYDQRFQWPLAAGLVCLLASLLIGTRKRGKKGVPHPQPARKAASILGLFALAALSSSAQASPQSAAQAYKRGNFTAAEKQYELAAGKNPQAAPLQFNLGAAAYKTTDYDTALAAFQKALGTEDVAVQQEAYYDMGNTQYRLGQKTETTGPQETIKTWQTAVQSYDAALKLKPDDADAQFNRDFVEKKLEQLQKQQKQNQQDQKQNQKNQNQNQQQSGSPQNQQNNQPNQQKQSQGNQADQQNQKSSSNSQQNQAQNGNQNQENPNPRQNQNGQQGQPKDQSSEQPQTAGNQNQKPPGSNQHQPNGTGTPQNSPLAQNGGQQAGPRGQTIPGQNPEKPQAAENQAETAPPGQMSPQEAKDLLNSLKSGEHVLPVTADNRNGGNHSPDDQPLRDW